VIRAITVEAETLRNPNRNTGENPERMRIENTPNSKLHKIKLAGASHMKK
jgi:hypothetical protein